MSHPPDHQADHQVVIGLDLGTTGCKAVAMDSRGRVLGEGRADYALHSSQGRAEQDVYEVWQGVQVALRALSGLEATPLALCISGAMHSLIPVAAGGNPLARATTWADNRAAPRLETLRRQTDPAALYRRTGCPLQAIYHPARLRHLQETDPDIFDRAERFVAIKDWVSYQLTDRWTTDLSLASTTGLLDIHSLRWDEAALDLAGVKADRLPTLTHPTEVIGRLSKAAATCTGLSEGLAVVAGASDGPLANLGSGAVAIHQVAITVGTSGAIRKTVDAPLLDEQERTWCYLLIPGHYVAGGAINNGGLTLEWARGMFYPDHDRQSGFETLLADAARVMTDEGDLLLLPYFTGERSPHWHPDARATLHGLSLRHTRAHIARAALEGVAFCLADVWDALGKTPTDAVRLTGGITQSRLWMQVLADVLGCPLVPVDVADASALGAAMLGHYALGHIEKLETLATSQHESSPLTPDPARHEAYAIKRKRFAALYHALEGVS